LYLLTVFILTKRTPESETSADKLISPKAQLQNLSKDSREGRQKLGASSNRGRRADHTRGGGSCRTVSRGSLVEEGTDELGGRPLFTFNDDAVDFSQLHDLEKQSENCG
jgi:hypothetical protein